MLRRLLLLAPIILLFTLACAGKTVSCTRDIIDTTIIQPKNDATAVPLTSFVLVESISHYQKVCDEPDCEHSESSYRGTGSYIFKSRIDSSVGFILTAKHICNHDEDAADDMKMLKHEFFIYDYHGNRRIAEKYFTSDNDDVCILISRDTSPDVDVAQLANKMPERGEKVFNVAAPRGFFIADAALIFEGIYSGLTGRGLAIFTITTQKGSSGSPIFNSQGKLIAMTVGMPYTVIEVGDDKVKIQVVEQLSYAVQLQSIREALQSVMSVDETLGISLIKTSSESKY